MSPASTHSESRRRQILTELHIDVWEVRTAEQIAAAVVVSDPSTTSSTTSSTSSSNKRGPAAAMALLADAQAPNTSRRPVSDADAGKRDATSPVLSASPSPTGAVGSAKPAVDLWCLSGPHGVLLANIGGLSTGGQRLLSDIFQAAMRILAAEPKAKAAGKVPVQQLRFVWPPADADAALATQEPTGRALRGFLGRALADKQNAALFLAAPELLDLLADVELAVAPERRLLLGDPEKLLGDGAAKRALWQMLNTL